MLIKTYIMSEKFFTNDRFVWYSTKPDFGDQFYAGGSHLSKIQYPIPCSTRLDDFIPITNTSKIFNCWPSLGDCIYNGKEFTYNGICDLVNIMHKVNDDKLI